MMTRNREAQGRAKSKPCQVPAPWSHTSGSPWPAVNIATLTPFTVIVSGLKCMAILFGTWQVIDLPIPGLNDSWHRLLVMSRSADDGALLRRIVFDLARHDDFRKPGMALGLPARALLLAILE